MKMQVVSYHAGIPVVNKSPEKSGILFNFIKGDKTYLEREPFSKITKKKQLIAFKHKGFWQCMDTLRDKEILEKKIKKKKI